jgi:hypothetical protein
LRSSFRSRRRVMRFSRLSMSRFSR